MCTSRRGIIVMPNTTTGLFDNIPILPNHRTCGQLGRALVSGLGVFMSSLVLSACATSGVAPAPKNWDGGTFDVVRATALQLLKINERIELCAHKACVDSAFAHWYQTLDLFHQAKLKYFRAGGGDRGSIPRIDMAVQNAGQLAGLKDPATRWAELGDLERELESSMEEIVKLGIPSESNSYDARVARALYQRASVRNTIAFTRHGVKSRGGPAAHRRFLESVVAEDRLRGHRQAAAQAAQVRRSREAAQARRSREAAQVRRSREAAQARRSRESATSTRAPSTPRPTYTPPPTSTPRPTYTPPPTSTPRPTYESRTRSDDDQEWIWCWSRGDDVSYFSGVWWGDYADQVTRLHSAFLSHVVARYGDDSTSISEIYCHFENSLGRAETSRDREAADQRRRHGVVFTRWSYGGTPDYR